MAQLPVWNVEVNGNPLRLKPKLELVLGTKAKHPNPVMLPDIKAQTGSQSWFPELVPQVQLLRPAGCQLCLSSACSQEDNSRKMG